MGRHRPLLPTHPTTTKLPRYLLFHPLTSPRPRFDRSHQQNQLGWPTLQYIYFIDNIDDTFTPSPVQKISNVLPYGIYTGGKATGDHHHQHYHPSPPGLLLLLLRVIYTAIVVVVVQIVIINNMTEPTTMTTTTRQMMMMNMNLYKHQYPESIIMKRHDNLRTFASLLWCRH